MTEADLSKPRMFHMWVLRVSLKILLLVVSAVAFWITFLTFVYPSSDDVLSVAESREVLHDLAADNYNDKGQLSIRYPLSDADFTLIGKTYKGKELKLHDCSNVTVSGLDRFLTLRRGMPPVYIYTDGMNYSADNVIRILETAPIVGWNTNRSRFDVSVERLADFSRGQVILAQRTEGVFATTHSEATDADSLLAVLAMTTSDKTKISLSLYDGLVSTKSLGAVVATRALKRLYVDGGGDLDTQYLTELGIKHNLTNISIQE